MTITIRRTEPDDYEAIWRIFSGPKAVAGTLQIPFPSAEQWRKRLAEPPEGYYSLVACVEQENGKQEIVGQLGLMLITRPRRRHVGQIGIAVRDDWQGKGVGTALLATAVDLADNWLNLTRLELEVQTDNVAAIRLYEKFGFRIEGTHIDYLFRDGRYVDAHSMARLKVPPATP